MENREDVTNIAFNITYRSLESHINKHGKLLLDIFFLNQDVNSWAMLHTK